MIFAIQRSNEKSASLRPKRTSDTSDFVKALGHLNFNGIWPIKILFGRFLGGRWISSRVRAMIYYARVDLLRVCA